MRKVFDVVFIKQLDIFTCLAEAFVTKFLYKTLIPLTDSLITKSQICYIAYI